MKKTQRFRIAQTGEHHIEGGHRFESCCGYWERGPPAGALHNHNRI